MLVKAPASVSVIVCLCVSWIFLEVLVRHVVQAQAQTTTAPNEGLLLNSMMIFLLIFYLFSFFFLITVKALNALYEKWGISASQNQWNISGEPCSGAAVSASIDIDDNNYNPFIKCDCSYNNNTLCHIVEM